MQFLKKESLEINFPILPIPNNIKDEIEVSTIGTIFKRSGTVVVLNEVDLNEFEDITYIQGKSWISLKASDCKYIWDFFPVFSNEAFRYYLPAVIYISFEELIKFQKLKDSDLLVDCTCQNMIGRMRDDLDIFKKFSSVQLRTILEWLLDLGEENSGLNPYDYKECVTWLSLLIEEKSIETI